MGCIRRVIPIHMALNGDCLLSNKFLCEGDCALDYSKTSNTKWPLA